MPSREDTRGSVRPAYAAAMEAAPDLTVVVLSWNTRALTMEALAAVPAGAAPKAVQTILVDNASGDGTAAAVRAAFPGVLVIENARNVGYARGNDAALPHVRGRYVCFLNSDARPTPGALAAVVRYLDERPGVGVASPPLVHPDGRFQRAAWGFPTALALMHQYTPMSLLGIGRREARRVRREREVPDATGPADAVSGACLVMRRELCERLGGFDPAYRFYYEDVDLCWRARASGAAVHVAADGPPVVHHGGASAALTGGAMRLPLLQGAMRFLSKRESKATNAWFRPAFKLGVALRATWEVVRAPAYAAVRRLRGRPERARR